MAGNHLGDMYDLDKRLVSILVLPMKIERKEEPLLGVVILRERRGGYTPRRHFVSRQRI